MKVKCPKCNEIATLEDDFSFVRCSSCSFDVTYGEYVKYIAYKDTTYADILNDYSGADRSKDQSLDDWD